MSGSIKISPKHGANPCIPVCAFCGKEKNEIALLGRLKNDRKAPMSAVLDYNPCEECLANWSQGIALIRVTDVPPVKDAVPLMEHDGVKLYPTACYTVITVEAAKRLFDIDGQKGMAVPMNAAMFDDFMAEAERQGATDGKEDGE